MRPLICMCLVDTVRMHSNSFYLLTPTLPCFEATPQQKCHMLRNLFMQQTLFPLANCTRQAHLLHSQAMICLYPHHLGTWSLALRLPSKGPFSPPQTYWSTMLACTQTSKSTKQHIHPGCNQVPSIGRGTQQGKTRTQLAQVCTSFP